LYDFNVESETRHHEHVLKLVFFDNWCM